MGKMAIFVFLIHLLFTSICFAEKIQGHACYTYGDNESLVQAEHTAKMLAIRNAIESNTIFIESTTQITDFQLTQDLLRSVSAGQVKGVKVLKRLESGRTLCYTVEGYVDPDEMQTAIKTFLKGKTEDVRLQENGWIRIMSHFVEEKTWEEREKEMGGDPQKIPEFLKNKIESRQLHVQIQFLKPCTATTRNLDKLSFIPGEKNSPEDSAAFNILLNRQVNKNKEWSQNNGLKKMKKFAPTMGLIAETSLLISLFQNLGVTIELKCSRHIYPKKDLKL